jgi:leader peptidase (prepilin peptidase) / N-methyltransferase
MTLELAIAGLFGLLFGSFLNVCIYRLPRDLSVVWPGSRCLACNHRVAAQDNIPVLSFFLLGGRCRHCRSSIHWRYPVVEALTAALFVAGVWAFGPTPHAAKFAVFAFLMVGMIFSDLETRLLPDEFTKGGIVLGLALSIFIPVKMGLMAVFLPQKWGRLVPLADAAAGAALVSGALWGFAWVYGKVRHKDGLGFGDVKMVAMIGAFLGLAPALMTVLIGCLTGSVVGLIYIHLTKKDFDTYEIPFGSFLGAAALFVAIWIP